jgi:hypothetical protein
LTHQRASAGKFAQRNTPPGRSETTNEPLGDVSLYEPANVADCSSVGGAARTAVSNAAASCDAKH